MKNSYEIAKQKGLFKLLTGCCFFQYQKIKVARDFSYYR